MSDKTFCKICQSEVNLKRCSKCKSVFYCSQVHQQVDWPVHKRECKIIRDNKKIEPVASTSSTSSSTETPPVVACISSITSDSSVVISQPIGQSSQSTTLLSTENTSENLIFYRSGDVDLNALNLANTNQSPKSPNPQESDRRQFFRNISENTMEIGSEQFQNPVSDSR